MRSLVRSSVLALAVVSASVLAACSKDDDGGAAASGGSAGNSATGGASSTFAGTSVGGGAPPTPATVCTAAATAADASKPDHVVGDGTAASCTEDAVRTAVTAGGVVTFACGAAPIVITVTSELAPASETVIDGGGLVTLDGGGTSRIIHLLSAYDQMAPKLTVQHLGFSNGFTTDVENTHEVKSGGAAIYRDGGALDVIDCQFTNNHGPDTGQDVSGGAITAQGVGPTSIEGSIFQGNHASNGGGVGLIGGDLTISNSTFDGNAATGTTGNPGNGGDGGAVVFDGAHTTLSLCGSTFTHNTSGATGGALFRVAYNEETTAINQCTFDANGSDPKVGLAGAMYLQDTTIAMTATTISNNSAHYGGGFWIGDSAIAQIVNVTIANNVADQGGGLWIAGKVTGSISYSTLAGNTNTPGGYAPGVFAPKDSKLQLSSSIVSGGGCKDGPLAAGDGAVLQNGDDARPCVPTPVAGDPALGDLADNGGPTKTMSLGAASAAIGQGTGCPATDQRGLPRKMPCALGAYEPQ